MIHHFSYSNHGKIIFGTKCAIWRIFSKYFKIFRRGATPHSGVSRYWLGAKPLVFYMILRPVIPTYIQNWQNRLNSSLGNHCSSTTERIELIFLDLCHLKMLIKVKIFWWPFLGPFGPLHLSLWFPKKVISNFNNESSFCKIICFDFWLSVL